MGGQSSCQNEQSRYGRLVGYKVILFRSKSLYKIDHQLASRRPRALTRILAAFYRPGTGPCRQFWPIFAKRGPQKARLERSPKLQKTAAFGHHDPVSGLLQLAAACISSVHWLQGKRPGKHCLGKAGVLAFGEMP